MTCSNATLLATDNITAVGLQTVSPCSVVSPKEEKIFTLSLYSFLLPACCLGNIFIIFMVFKRQELRKTVNYFIVNMAVSDLAFSLTMIPIQLTGFATGSHHWRVGGTVGLILCKFYAFTPRLSYLISSQSLVWIAIDRFVAILFPMKIGLISTKIRITAIASSWIVAFALNSPLLVTWTLSYNGNTLYCAPVNRKSVFPNQKADSVYFWLVLTLCTIVPLSLMTFLYTAIAVALKRQSKALVHMASNLQKHSLRKQKRAVQMCFAIMIAYYICALPHGFLYFVYYWSTSCVFRKTFSITAEFLLFSSAAVNPIISLSFVESYRRGLKNIVCSCGRIRRNKTTLNGIKY